MGHDALVCCLVSKDNRTAAYPTVIGGEKYWETGGTDDTPKSLRMRLCWWVADLPRRTERTGCLPTQLARHMRKCRNAAADMRGPIATAHPCGPFMGSVFR